MCLFIAVAPGHLHESFLFIKTFKLMELFGLVTCGNQFYELIVMLPIF